MKIKVSVLIFLSFLLCGTMYAQKKSSKKITISGLVIDAARNPVPGAVILVDKKNSNVVTDSKGHYKVKVKSSAQKITVFTFQGGSLDTEINGRKIINFIMEGPQARENAGGVPAGEETVNIGYGNVKSRDLTTSVGQVDGSGEKYASYANIYDMLRGTVAGVQVIGKNITIQGIGTINANNQPLLVVDGIVVGSIDDIHPVQVKSVEVLKGASASIYGSRGANGVLLITLKGHGDR